MSEPSGRESVVELAVSATPSASRGILERAYRGTASPRQAIKAKCLECACCDRASIGGCAAFRCPLWAYRPYQSDAEEGEE
jgi:hypothetical protein